MASTHQQHDDIKFMIVGDSISHGREGDWTWRYRIWEWFRHEDIRARFVGPYKGTFPPDKPKAPQPPPFASEHPRIDIPRSDGGYARGISPEFLANPDHFSAGGRQAAQAEGLIYEQVHAYQPDFCLVQLGFNDLGWGVSGPEGTLASMQEFVDKARSAKPDLKFAIANVPHRTAVFGFPELPVMTDKYNKLLAHAITDWSTETSPIALVDFCSNYSCGGTNSLASYDGLHPNALGEYQLAQSFSLTLHTSFSLGHTPLSIPPPEHIPSRPTPTPTNLVATPAPSGIITTWDPVYGAYWYDLRARVVGPTHTDDSQQDNSWTTHRVTAPRHDTTASQCADGQTWEYQVRAGGGDTVFSPWSEVVSAVARPRAAPPPVDIRTHPTDTGFTISWTAPPADGNWTGEIERYGVYAFDHDTPGSFPKAVGVRPAAILGLGGLGEGGMRTQTEVTGLVEGHRYGVAVDTWTVEAGGGRMGGGRSVVVGGRTMGAPVVPGGVQVRVIGRTTGELEWIGDEMGAAGFRVWLRRNGGGSEREELGTGDKPRVYCEMELPRGEALADVATMKQLLSGLHPSVWAYEFAISAYNGDDESALSEWIRAPGATATGEGVSGSLAVDDSAVSFSGSSPLPSMAELLSARCEWEVELETRDIDLGERDSLDINLDAAFMVSLE